MQAQVTRAVQVLKERLEAFLAIRVRAAPDDWKSQIQHAVHLQDSAEIIVRAVIQQARADGATWQVIGVALGVTRQAAFQHYGKPMDPRTGEPMNTTPLPEATTLAVAVIEDLAAGRWSQVTDRLDPVMRDGLSEEALGAAWAQVVGLSGAFETHGAPVAARADEMTITNTPLHFEAGDYTARIMFRDDRSIAGLYILDSEVS